MENKDKDSAKCKRIPISAAKRISEDCNFPEVVIFAYDPVSGNQHITTYGRTIEQCKEAARAGNYLKKALHWPEKLCHAKPARELREEKANEKRE